MLFHEIFRFHICLRACKEKLNSSEIYHDKRNPYLKKYVLVAFINTLRTCLLPWKVSIYTVCCFIIVQIELCAVWGFQVNACSLSTDQSRPLFLCLSNSFFTTITFLTHENLSEGRGNNAVTHIINAKGEIITGHTHARTERAQRPSVSHILSSFSINAVS